MVVKSKKKQWFNNIDRSETGWKKDMPTDQRRKVALKAHKGDLLATARSLMALANVTRDDRTAKLAKSDALYFYREYEKKK